MIKGPVLVKARKIALSPVVGRDDEFYLEFELNGSQKNGILAELMIEHVHNGTLTVIHQHGDSVSETVAERKMNFLKSMLDENPEMDNQIRNEFLTQIAELSKTS